MKNASQIITIDHDSNVSMVGFCLSDCVVETDPLTAKYLRVVHRTALELSVQNRFGFELGGFWLLMEQLAELRRLPDFYPRDEAPLVRRAVEAYIAAQLPCWLPEKK